MSSELAELLGVLGRERGIPMTVLQEALESALATAYKKHFGVQPEKLVVHIRMEFERSNIRYYLRRTVQEEPESPHTGISLEEAQRLQPGAKLGDVIETRIGMDEFGRIAAAAAKQAIVQKLREVERDALYNEWKQKEGEVVVGVISRYEQATTAGRAKDAASARRADRSEPRNAIVELGELEALMPPEEQERQYRIRERLKVYVKSVERDRAGRGLYVVVSRTQPGLIRRLFENEVPEIREGLAVIKAVARDAGSRTKVAVAALEPGIDPVGSCVGKAGTRVQAVVRELYDEKVDIVRWSAELDQFVAEALSPAKVKSVDVVTGHDGIPTARVIVDDSQLSLAIGRGGQNVRLAAKLTGCRIDIRSESQAAATQADAESDPTPSAP